MRNSTIRLVAASFSLLGAAGFASVANAAGTTAGTSVDNVATVNYNVGGAPQQEVESSPEGNDTPGNNGTATTFIVDRQLNLNVVAQVAPVPVPAGYDNTGDNTVAPGNAYALVYDVTNLSNSIQDLNLAAFNNNTNNLDDTVTDEFDGANLRIYEDTNGNGSFDAGDLEVSFLDEVNEDETIRVFVVATTPAANLVAAGDNASITLAAQIHEAGAAGLGAESVETVGGDTHTETETASDAAVETDTMFIDAAAVTSEAVSELDFAGDGPGTGNAAGGDEVRDGEFADTAHYVIVGTVINVTKTSEVISDPFNLTVNPLRIPGATVRYTITVENTGTLDAESVVISDEIPANTTYVIDSVTIGGVATPDSDANVTYNPAGNGSLAVATGTVTEVGTAPNNLVAITFDVIID